jgi:uncharacterized repeat protein (TIGR01451 family)
MRCFYLLLAITITCLSPIQSQEIDLLNGVKGNQPLYTINPDDKPLIQLKPIDVTNDIVAIKTAKQKWNTGDFKNYTPNIADQVEYQITVSNRDSINSLENISIVSKLSNGTIFVSSRIVDDQGASRQILPINISNNELTWRIEEIKPNRQVIIKQITAFVDNYSKRFDNRVYVEGTWDTEYASIVDRSQEVSSDDINQQEKPLIHLGTINVTNTIIAIKTANQEWNTQNTKNYVPNIADKVEYMIIITNTDTVISLKNINVVSKLPIGMIYVSSNITEDPGESCPISMSNNEIKWRINEIKPNSQVTIKQIAAFLDNNPRQFENKVHAEGTWDMEYASIIDESQVVSSVIHA